jgi:TatD DNase family protein
MLKNFFNPPKNLKILNINIKFFISKKMMSNTNDFKLFDIAANLCDEKFKGIYGRTKYHDEDVDEVIARAKKFHVEKMLFASGSLEDAHDSYELTKKGDNFYTTVGVHPCRAQEAENTKIDISEYFLQIKDTIEKYKDKVIAVGECGLDYDRFHYSGKEVQLKYFSPHFNLAQELNLPMYLHSRNTNDDFYQIVKENRHKFSTGVVHSFTEELDVLEKYLQLDLYIGVNGCSLKTKENLEVVKAIPLDKIMLETDAPYCDIRNTHASSSLVKTQFKDKIKKEKMQKGLICKDRNEPCMMIQVLEVVAALKGVTEKELADISYENSLKMFNLKP